VEELVFEIAGDASGQLAQLLHEALEFAVQLLTVLG
jgi:hypothetical protein